MENKAEKPQSEKVRLEFGRLEKREICYVPVYIALGFAINTRIFVFGEKTEFGLSLLVIGLTFLFASNLLSYLYSIGRASFDVLYDKEPKRRVEPWVVKTFGVICLMLSSLFFLAEWIGQ